MELKPVSHYKRRKKVNLTTAVFIIITAMFLCIITVLAFRVYDQNMYEKKMQNFIKGEFSLYKKHYKNMTFDIFIQTKKSCKKYGVSLPEILSLQKNESNFKQYASRNDHLFLLLLYIRAYGDLLPLAL